MISFGRRLRIATAAAAAAAAGALAPAAVSAAAVTAPPIVSPVPADFSPAISGGTVFAMAEVAGQIVIGGDFTSANPANDPTDVLDQADALAFDETTGALNTGFRPHIAGRVNTVVPGPTKHQVYVGGTFDHVDGRATRLALLDLRTGRIVAGWHPPAFNLGVNKVVLADGRLFVGGAFTKVGRHAYHGLVALNPRTGRPTSYLKLPVAGHHNWGRQCDPNPQTCVPGRPGVRGLAVNPAGTMMVATGNFTTIAGKNRDQVAMINLGRHSASVDAHWKTKAFTARCFSQSFDSYIRDVAFSPTGNYFVIAASGGIGLNHDGTNSSCDSASRYDTADTGTDVRPRWIDYSGEDSILTEEITRSAVYIGGHQRWLNNRYGQNIAGPGAVPRPGIAALNPKNGLPYSWNPGRNPRGAGCFALLATSQGLWIGSDTDYIGDHAYLRPKIAFFPFAGGEVVPPEPTPSLPGRVFEVGATGPAALDPGRLDFRQFDGTSATPATATSTGVDWSTVRGAFTVDGVMFYGKADGNLYERAFDGTSAGPEVEVAPYDDPAWVNVQTGSGQTYQGLPTTMASEIPSVTSMFFTDGRLYYTVAGDASMFWRDFEPESGVIGAVEHSISDGHDWSNIAGAFEANGHVYYADQTSGELLSVPWSKKGALALPTVVDASTDWASRGLFLLG